MISVIIPVWNRGSFLRRSVGSVLSQIAADDEVIIVDDGSSDDSVGTAKMLAQEDGRIRLLHNSRKKGASGARNTGIFASTGNWVAFLDSDDEWLPGFYNDLVSVCNSDDNIDIVTCHSQVVEEREDAEQFICGYFRSSPRGKILSQLLSGELYIDMNGAIIKKSRLLAIGGLDENCPSFQEWDLHIRLATDCIYTCVPKPLVNYWQHPGQMSRDKSKSVNGLIYMMRKHRPLWRAELPATAWRRRCVELANSASELRPKVRRFGWQIILIDPRVLIWQLSAKTSVLKDLPYSFAKNFLGRNDVRKKT